MNRVTKNLLTNRAGVRAQKLYAIQMPRSVVVRETYLRPGLACTRGFLKLPAGTSIPRQS
jgi:hypothetical protein